MFLIFVQAKLLGSIATVDLGHGLLAWSLPTSLFKAFNLAFAAE